MMKLRFAPRIIKTLKGQLLKAGLTHPAVALACGVSVSLVERIIRGGVKNLESPKTKSVIDYLAKNKVDIHQAYGSRPETGVRMISGQVLWQCRYCGKAHLDVVAACYHVASMCTHKDAPRVLSCQHSFDSNGRFCYECGYQKARPRK
jgi:hypothetical protein